MWSALTESGVPAVSSTAPAGASNGATALLILGGFSLLAMLAIVAVASRVAVTHLAIGFAATVAMWALGYIAMTAPGLPAGEVLFALMLLCVGASGFIAARRGGVASSGLVVGLVSAAVNLLVVGSLIGGRPAMSIEVERDGRLLRLPLFVPLGADEELGASGEPVDAARFLGLRLDFDDAGASLPRVAEVFPRGAAHDAGVEPGDRVRLLDGRVVTSAEGLERIVRLEREQSSTPRSWWALWISGLFVVSGALGWLGGLIGSRRRGEPIREPAMLFAIVTSVAIMLLLTTGGLVTGLEAGLAVPDWPNSFGHNMLLYPLSEMKGGVYYEHAHRLFGMLVGVTVLVLLTVVFRCERRMWILMLAGALLLAVIVQGLLGAMRVTGEISMSPHRADHAPSVALAVVHGVVGQMIFAASLLLAAGLSPTWRSAPAPRPIAGGSTMRIFSGVLVLLLVVQLVLGACYRHLTIPPQGDFPGSSPTWALHLHITLAAVIMVVALLAGFRAKALGRDEGVPIVPALGRSVHIVVGVQILLGILAFVAVSLRRSAEIPAWEVIVTTAHQAAGAILLGLAALLMAWSHRLIREQERPSASERLTPRPAAPA